MGDNRVEDRAKEKSENTGDRLRDEASARRNSDAKIDSSKSTAEELARLGFPGFTIEGLQGKENKTETGNAPPKQTEGQTKKVTADSTPARDADTQHRGDDSRERVRTADAKPAPVERTVGWDGRLVSDGHRARIAAGFPGLRNMERAVQQVEKELADVKASSGDSKQTLSVLERLNAENRLSEAEKRSVKEFLAEVREHYTNMKDANGRMLAGQEVNWIHTQGELGRVLDAATTKGLKGAELHDVLVAAMFSDAAKFDQTATTKANFTTHHLDGALAAAEVLERKGFPKERIDRITQAILEHQVAPPKFMGMIYRGAIAGALEAKKSSMPVEEYNRMKGVLEGMTEKGSDGILRIKQIADVPNTKLVKDSNGKWEVDFTQEQRELLKLTGLEHWHVPVDPKSDPSFSELSPPVQRDLMTRYMMSQALLEGDFADNYATIGGASKIVKIRGPETIFRDATVWDSIKSVNDSFNDGASVLSKAGRKQADAALAERDEHLSKVRGQMETWLEEQRKQGRQIPLNENGRLPFFHEDAPLKYPDSLNGAETKRLNELQTALANKSLEPAKAKELQRELNELKYKGLTPAEIGQFEFAKEIRQKMVDLMRAGQRIDGQAPGAFEPVPQNRDFKTGERLKLKGQSETVEVAGTTQKGGERIVLHTGGSGPAIAVAEPLTDKSAYETVKLTVNGKEETRLFDGENLFKVSTVDGEQYITRDNALSVITAEALETQTTAQPERAGTTASAGSAGSDRASRDSSSKPTASDRNGSGTSKQGTGNTDQSQTAATDKTTSTGQPSNDKGQPGNKGEAGADKSQAGGADKTPAVPPRPERSAPLAERVTSTALEVGASGTVRIEQHRAGETRSAEQAVTTEISTDMVRQLEQRAREMLASDSPELREKGRALTRVAAALDGTLGPQARTTAQRGIIEQANKELGKTEGQRRSGGAGAAIGVGILLSAALGWYASEQNRKESALPRAKFQ